MPYSEIKCCCCDWEGRTHRYPGHLVGRHLAQIQRTRSFGDHCLYLGIGEMDCYTCLTCDKGTIHTSVGRIGDRWSEMHSKQKKCRDAHPEAYARFKALWTAARESVVAAEKEALAMTVAKAEAAAAVKGAGGVGDLWVKMRGNKRLADYMQDVEKRMEEAHAFEVDEDDEDPAPYVFDPVEAFERAIAEAMSLRKEVVLTKQKMSEMVVAHDAELSVHRAELIRVGRETMAFKNNASMLGEEIRELNQKVKDHEERMKDLEAELAALKAKTQ